MGIFLACFVISSPSLAVGEAVYLDDVPALPNELHGAFVQSAEANARISSIDTTEAMVNFGRTSHLGESASGLG